MAEVAQVTVWPHGFPEDQIGCHRILGRVSGVTSEQRPVEVPSVTASASAPAWASSTPSMTELRPTPVGVPSRGDCWYARRLRPPRRAGIDVTTVKAGPVHRDCSDPVVHRLRDVAMLVLR
jgi:hypothetical protein